MLLSKLSCPACNYQSEAFGDTCDVHEETYSFVFQNPNTHEIWIEEVPSATLNVLSIHLGAPDSQTKLDQAFLDDQKRLVRIPIGQQLVDVSAVCPKCGHPFLKKVLIGLQ